MDPSMALLVAASAVDVHPFVEALEAWHGVHPFAGALAAWHRYWIALPFAPAEGEGAHGAADCP